MESAVQVLRKAAPAVALGLLLTPLVFVMLGTALSGFPDLAVEGDLAMLEMATGNAAAGRTLLGPYSRYGFHHPGPAYLFLRMPALWLTGGSSSGSYLTVPAIMGVCMAAAFLAVRRFGKTFAAAAFCLIVGLYLVGVPWVVWLRDWNPFVIISPFLLYVVSCAAVASGGREWIPAAVLSGSFAAQTHLGGAPVVAALAVFTLPAALRKPSQGAPSRFLVGGAVLAVALWLPVLMEELGTGEGNLCRILRFFRDVPPDAGIKVALREWSGALMASESRLMFPALLRARGILMEAILVAALVKVVALALVAALLPRKHETAFARALALVTLVSVIFMFLGALQLRGEPHGYLFTWYSVVSPLFWLTLACSLPLCLPGAKRLFGVLTLAVMSAAALPPAWIIRSISTHGGQPFDPLEYSDNRVESLSRGLETFLHERPGEAWILEPRPGELWPVSAGLVHVLFRRGFDIHPDPLLSGLLGVEAPARAERLVLAEEGSGEAAGLTVVAAGSGLVSGLPREGEVGRFED